MAQTSGVIIYTIGHSNHPIERFIELLEPANIEILVDVRSLPGSRFHPQFNRTALDSALERAGVTYRWLGDRLGGKPKDPALQNADGHPDYARMARTPAFQVGINELLALAHQCPVAIMCAEEDPLHCHRTKLVTPALIERDIHVRHLRGDGSAIAHEDLAMARAPRQGDLLR